MFWGEIPEAWPFIGAVPVILAGIPTIHRALRIWKKYRFYRLIDFFIIEVYLVSIKTLSQNK